MARDLALQDIKHKIPQRRHIALAMLQQQKRINNRFTILTMIRSQALRIFFDDFPTSGDLQARFAAEHHELYLLRRI